MLEDFQIFSFKKSDSLFKECLELRHTTFVEETKIFEYEGEDEFDGRSVHILLKHLPSGRYIGCARIILGKPCPTIETLSIYNKDREYYNSINDYEVGEISRLCVPRSVIEDLDLKILPSLPLFIGIIQSSNNHQIRYWVTVMEPRLNRLLSRYGLDLKKVGDTQDYYGRRAPYLSKIEDVLEQVKSVNLDLYYYIREKLR